ncbi:hypothetical protein [Planococcus sp. ISL-109]|nr:hypothetical protein [Planococcus sp. ISL-109]MBT2581598.1 hypothetical protein [Planococcus sp. ISL-109]
MLKKLTANFNKRNKSERHFMICPIIFNIPLVFSLPLTYDEKHQPTA